MGRDKAFLKINGEALIERQLRLLEGVFRNVIIVTNSPQKYTGFKSVKIISDVIPGRGPLGGIYSGLLASDSFHNFVAACDMPFMNIKLIKHMITFKDAFDIVVPRIDGRYEALFAVYSKNCVKPIHEAFKKDNLRVRELFGKVRTKEITGGQIKRFGDPKVLFMNVNTKKDLCRMSAC